MQAEKEDQEIAESCNRLIKNCIICWNYLYLTHKLRQITDDREKEQLLSIISSHSIMTWRISICLVNTISPKKSVKILSEFYPRKWPPESIRKTGGIKFAVRQSLEMIIENSYGTSCTFM